MLQPLLSRVPAHIRVFGTRAAYKAFFGVEAPAHRPDEPVKNWIDMREGLDADEEVEYTGIRYEANGTPRLMAGTRTCVLQSFRLYPELAKAVNLLPEPMPIFEGAALLMSQRQRPMPLELKTGEKVVLDPTSNGPVVDDGVKLPATQPVAFTQGVVDMIAETHAAVKAKL